MSANFTREVKLKKPRALLPELFDQVNGLWIDAASGDGVFAEVLLELATPDTTVACLDLKDRPLQHCKSAIDNHDHRIAAIQADLCSPFPIKGADGIILANALHFFPFDEQMQILRRCFRTLKKSGKLVIVEYNTNRPTGPVPHPVPLDRIDHLLLRSGFQSPRISSVVGSSYLGEMYAVLAETNSSRAT